MQSAVNAMRYANGKCSFDPDATTPLKSAAEQANCFATFGRDKFKSLKGQAGDVPPLPDGSRCVCYVVQGQGLIRRSVKI